MFFFLKIWEGSHTPFCIDFPFSRKSLVVTLTLGHSQDMSFGSQLEARSASSDQKSRCIKTNLLESLVSKIQIVCP